jgi:hypothetical protein
VAEHYLSPDALRIGERYGVPVCWVGEDGDMLAVTHDRRRALAAVHRLCRETWGCPAVLRERYNRETDRTERDVDAVWVQFHPGPNDELDVGEGGWWLRHCEPNAPQAVAVTLVGAPRERSSTLGYEPWEPFDYAFAWLQRAAEWAPKVLPSAISDIVASYLRDAQCRMPDITEVQSAIEVFDLVDPCGGPRWSDAYYAEKLRELHRVMLAAPKFPLGPDGKPLLSDMPAPKAAIQR